MKNTISLLMGFAFATINILCCYAQPPVIDWQKCLGGSNNDNAYLVQQTTDAGFMVAGVTASYDGDISGKYDAEDIWIIKLNAAGNIEWQKTLGGNGYDYTFSAEQTTDGGYIVAGISTSNDGDVTGNHGSEDAWVVKLDASGNREWQHAYGGTNHDGLMAIQQSGDGGYIAAGYTFSHDGDVSGNHGGADCWVIRMDEEGYLLWQKSLGGSLQERAYSVQATSDDGFIMAGITESSDGDVTQQHGAEDGWLVKLNSNGNLEWKITYGGIDNDGVRCIRQTSDNGYIFTGYSGSNSGDVTGNHGAYDYWTVRTDATGNIMWQKSLGGSGDDEALAVNETAEGGFIMAGNSISTDGDVTGNHGSQDYWLVKLSDEGSIDWQGSYGGTDFDNATSLQETADHGFIVGGTSSSINGDVSGNHGYDDIWIVRLEGITAIDESPSPLLSFSVYPQPLTAVSVLSFSLNTGSEAEVSLFDLAGRKIQSLLHAKLPAGTHRLPLDNFMQPAGIYLLRLTINSESILQKVIVQ